MSDDTFYCPAHQGTAPIEQRELVDMAEQGSGPGIPAYACTPCVLTGRTAALLALAPLGIRRAP